MSLRIVDPLTPFSSPVPPSAQCRYAVPVELGIFRLLDSEMPDMSARNIIHRIVDKRKVRRRGGREGHTL